MSQVHVVVQLSQIRKLEDELFELIARQRVELITGVPKNVERAKRIDDLQTLYVNFKVK